MHPKKPAFHRGAIIPSLLAAVVVDFGGNCDSSDGFDGGDQDYQGWEGKVKD